MTVLGVPSELDGERLDVAVAVLLDISRSAAAGLVTDGLVEVDGIDRPRSFRVTAGQSVVVTERKTVAVPPPPLPPIRFQDEHVLVLAKPAGMVVHPGAGHPQGTLVDALVAAGVELAIVAGEERPGIVHRLDKDTSGLLVVAKTDAAYHGLVQALQRRDVVRRYLALVEGRLPGRSGQVDAPIGRDPTNRVRFAVSADGRTAITDWERHDTGKLAGTDVTAVQCRLRTGRTHQIRVHLAYAGCPVVGDRLYGASTAVAAAAGVHRPLLHAWMLGFEHPVTGERVMVTEPMPTDLVTALRRSGADEHPPAVD